MFDIRLFFTPLFPPLDNQSSSKLRSMLRTIILILCITVSAPLSHALTGKVIGIADGDTITILDSSKTQHKIRLCGIDCTEGDQPFGKARSSYPS